MTFPTTDCSERDRFGHLLAGCLNAEEQADLIVHLDACEACQRLLEDLTGAELGKRPWPKDQKAEPFVPEGPALRRLIEDLKDRGPTAAVSASSPTASAPAFDPVEELDLGFLGPPEEPGHLGRLGPYQVLGVIGKGGMGMVLKAFDLALHRVVAIKVLHPRLATGATARRRFLREAQAAAAVCHDHVVTIHAVDEWNGLPYLVMRFIAGHSLQERIDRSGPLEVREILRIGVQTAAGLAAAHAQGLVHRDVKPANILLENGVERVKLTDFGLARAADDASLTQSGVVAGTPQYMAPEQARGEPVDHRADLFSLGSVLYAMCTGRPPFRASTTMAILRRVSDEPARPVRELNPDVPEWLAEIIDRLHAKDPAERFQTADEVADLLGQHLARLQQPTFVPARSLTPTVTIRPMKPAPRDKVAPTARPASSFGPLLGCFTAIMVVVLLMVLASYALYLFRSSRQPLVASLPSDRPGVILAETSGNGGPIWSLAFAPDGQTLASGHRDGLGRLWDLQINRWFEELPRHLRGHSAAVRSVAFSPDGRTLATGSFDTTAQLWDTTTGRRLALLKGHGDTVNAVAFSPNGRTLASASLDGTVRLWDVDSGQELRTIEDRDDWVLSLAFSPDGQSLATGGRSSPLAEPSLVLLRDVATGQCRATLEGHDDWVEAVAFTPDGRTLASGSHDGTVRLWDVESGTPGKILRHSGLVESLAFSPDGRLLAVGGETGIVWLWDHEKTRLLATLPAADVQVYALAFSPNGQVLATGSHDGVMKIWDVEALEREAAATLAEARGGPFVVLSNASGIGEQAFKSLAAAINNAPHGATIEIQGNGPFRLPASGVEVDRPLTIRAGEGYVPVLQQEAAARPGEQRSKFLLRALAPLTLEGLDLDRTGAHETATERSVLLVKGGPVRIANCKIQPNWPGNYAIWLNQAPDLEIRNTFFGGACGDAIVSYHCASGDRIALSNCITSPGVKRHAISYPNQPSPVDVLRIELEGNTIATSPVVQHAEGRIGRLEIRASHNIFLLNEVLTLWGQPRESAEAAVKERFRWEGRRNLLPRAVALVRFDAQPMEDWQTLDEWNRLWEGPEEGTTLGIPRFDRLNSIQELAWTDDPADWRLAPNSPGYQAGDDGRDLGANVDLVGPGAAYERWKQTPDYRSWVADEGGGEGAATAEPSIGFEGAAEPPIIRESRTFEPIHDRPICGVAVSPDGRLAASAGADTRIVLWDVATGRQVRSLSGHEKGVVTVAFAPDGHRILSGGEDGTCRVWEVETGRELNKHEVEEGWIFSVGVSPGGGQAAIGIADWNYRGNGVLLWDLKQNRPALEFQGIAHPAMGLAYSPDGRRVLVGGGFRLGVGLWNAETGQRIRRFVAPHTQIRGVAFSPDGRLAASGHWAERIEDGVWVDPDHGIVILWDPETGQEIRRLRGHSGNVNGVAFSPDGRFLASGSGGRHNEVGYFEARDNTIRLWDTADGRELCRFDPGTSIHSVAFTPDGRQILSGGRDGRVRLWDVPMD